MQNNKIMLGESTNIQYEKTSLFKFNRNIIIQKHQKKYWFQEYEIKLTNPLRNQIKSILPKPKFSIHKHNYKYQESLQYRLQHL